MSLLVHAGLLAALLERDTAQLEPDGQATTVAVKLLLIPLREPALPQSAPAKKAIARSRVRDLAPPTMRPVPPSEPEASSLATNTTDETAGLTVHGAATREDMLEHAKRNVAGILHEIDKELPKHDKGLTSDRQQRLDRRFAEAHAAAVPGWRRAARIEEIPGTGTGSRVYRISTALGSYCVTYSAGGGRPTYGSCPD